MLLLVAHGSKRPAWRRPLEALRDQLAQRAAGETIRLAYLEACPPTVAEVAAEAVADDETSLRVLPLFISAGGHVRHDLAPQLEAIAERHSTLEVELLPTLGEHPLILDALAEIARATGPPSPLPPR